MDNVDETALNIYTDGSSYSNPRAGGLGIRFITVDAEGNEVIVEHSPSGYSGATNNQMELQACIDALGLITGRRPLVDYSKLSKIIIKTDSRYVTENVKNAMYTWPQNSWFKSDGKPVLNAFQWKELIRLVKKTRKRVEFKWVKGHKSSVHNNAVDKLAKQSAMKKTKKRISIVDVRRRLSPKSVEQGSIKMGGQIAIIRIISDELLKVQKCYRYKYEVLSKTNPFYQNVDFAISDISLSAGHTYFVKFNSDSSNPRIEKVFSEFFFEKRT
jgi:ribonuclease HI